MDFITDRNEADVIRWKTLHDKGWHAMNAAEQAEWQSYMKGCYNFSDMNRVELAVQELSARLTKLGFLPPALQTKTAWSNVDIPTKADFDRYFSNVDALKQVLPMVPSTPATPTTAERFNYLKANDLEQILLDIDTATTNLQKAWYFPGEIFAGEV